MARPLHPKSTATSRTVTTRRYAFDHDALGDDRHWLHHDIVGSHLVAALSGVIPPGERFVAASVRDQRQHLDGPLRDQINGFVGQERLHQREHQAFNEALARLGYPTGAIDRASALTFALLRRFPGRFQVAMAAAIEHWTAVIAEHTLEADLLAGWDTADVAKAFLDWHLVEELEHKAVAFDVMQAMGATEAERMAAMHVATLMLLPSVVGGFLLSLATDPTARRGEVRRSLGRSRRIPVDPRAFVRDLLSWHRPGFHPDERNVDELLAEWREKLFAADGFVTANSRPRAAV